MKVLYYESLQSPQVQKFQIKVEVLTSKLHLSTFCYKFPTNKYESQEKVHQNEQHIKLDISAASTKDEGLKP